ncbi:MAG TPA: polyphosphate kinase 2 family protein [Actinomycetota bacterium]|nr:polyphosphate kinase 2 family protein [Actinomycetota bacterium]
MNLWRIEPGSRVVLDDIPTKSSEGAPGNSEETKAAMKPLREEIAHYQERLWAESAQSLLVVLQAMDTAGKDSTIKSVFTGVNPQGVHVTSFKAPNSTERQHDFLWRIHPAAPATGEIGVFNRSHYEDVLIVRVKNLIPESVWRPRYEMINHFEQVLAAGRTRIVKFFLHISNEEQAHRLQARIDDPTKRWKFNPDDLKERALWEHYQAAYQEAIERTSTQHAPWYVIPSDRKWYRNWAVARAICDVLTEMNPQYPDPAELDPDLKIL